MENPELPSSFVRLIAAIAEGGWPHFVLKGNADAYGDYFDNSLEVVLTHDDPASVRLMTDLCPGLFLAETDTSPLPEQPQEAADSAAGEPGFIPALTDFTRVIFFGRNSFGRHGEISYYCFDYRTTGADPGVICWQNGYWRRVAPDFEGFFALWQLAPNRFRESDVGYWEMEEARIARTAEALSRI